MILIIIYKGRKYELEVNGNDNVRMIMEKFYILSILAMRTAIMLSTGKQDTCRTVIM